MLLSYRLLLLFFFLPAGFTASAQREDSLKNALDSLSIAAPVADTVVSAAKENDDEEDEEDNELLPDTAITSIYRQINADTLALIKRDKGFYYQSWLDSLLRAKAAAQKKPVEKRNIDLPDVSGFFSIFKIMLWVIAVAIVLFVIYKLTLGSNALFLKGRKNIDIAIDTTEDVPDGRYEGLIKKAEGENNFRLAVRYLHLQALYKLGEQDYIRLATDKTNYQYLNELRSKAANIAARFSALTYKYEYIWYGEYMITNVAYYGLKREFNEFNREIE